MTDEKVQFPAVFTEEVNGVSIDFPDLPGCLPCAVTMEEAHKNAREALWLRLFGMKEDGDEIPTASAPATLEVGEKQILVIVEADMTVVPKKEGRENVDPERI